MRFTYIFASLFFYLTLSSAWPWPANLFIRDASGQLARRDDPSSNSTASPASSQTQPAKTSGAASGSSSPSPTNKPNGNDNGKKNGTMTSSITITQAEAGGVSMINPPAASTTYYKLGQNITFVWNYTSLVVTPTAVDVVVSCQTLGATYTIASNMTVNQTATVIWDTALESTANPPPDTDKYTLAIWDAGVAAGPTQTVGPGMLGVWDQFTFAMYTPQPYTPLSEGYMCVTCNGALSSHERQTLGVLFTMATITVLSFSYFSSGFLTI